MQLMTIARWLHRRAENILAIMLGLMFAAFIAQIIFRYFLNFPIGWTSELTVIMWLWMILWGAAFVIREDEEIRFDLVYGAVPAPVRRIMFLLAGAALLALYIFSLPAVVDFVTFMKVQSTAYLKIRFDWLYSIYVIFAVAVICRYAFLMWRAIRGRNPSANDPTESSSPL